MNLCSVYSCHRRDLLPTPAFSVSCNNFMYVTSVYHVVNTSLCILQYFTKSSSSHLFGDLFNFLHVNLNLYSKDFKIVLQVNCCIVTPADIKRQRIRVSFHLILCCHRFFFSFIFQRTCVWSFHEPREI